MGSKYAKFYECPFFDMCLIKSKMVIKLITKRQLLNMLWCLNNTKAIAQLKENTFNAFSLAVDDSSYCSYGGIGGVYQSCWWWPWVFLSWNISQEDCFYTERHGEGYDFELTNVSLGSQYLSCSIQFFHITYSSK